jgi:DNA (cytosine-5)-methyltransferase 1
VELFGGCGGLGLGLARAGFRSRAFVEWSKDAVETVRFNSARHVPHIRDWRIVHADVRTLEWERFRDQLALVSGGPPCQPFGIGGLKKGSGDPRDMWPEAIRAVREIRPSAFVFENVRNLAGPRFKLYLHWIEHSLRHAGQPPCTDGETPEAHLRRHNGTAADYRTSVSVVNAADFGAPQIRYRVLIAGLRTEYGRSPGQPVATHGLEALLWDQWVTGEYWERHGMPAPPRDTIPDAHRPAIRKLAGGRSRPEKLPWVTVRDAIAGLGEPNGRNNHVFQPGARVYAGHTGSALDWPAKALKAGDHGVPGGENMMVLPDGSVRYFTLRETARLVGLPDDYAFCRSWTESMRGLGNAVPVQLAEAAGAWIRDSLALSAGLRKRAA